MSLDTGRLIISTALKLGLTKTLDQSQRLTLKTAVEASTGTAVDEVDKLKKVIRMLSDDARGYLLSGHDEELLQIDSTVRELAESTLLLEFSSVSLK